MNLAIRLIRPLVVLATISALAVVPTIAEPAPAVAATKDACGVRIPKGGGRYWTCTFVDNFNGTSLNPKKWTGQISGLSGFTMNQTCFEHGKGYAVGNGRLKLIVQRKAWFDCKTPHGVVRARAVGGAVSTYNRWDQTRGRFEARMKFPSFGGRGLHGGFWMNPRYPTYGAWPASGEIDVAEWYSVLKKNVFPSLHYAGRTAYDTAYNCTPGRTDLFHTYTVVWQKYRMTFKYDGKTCFTRYWKPTNVAAPAPFDKPFTLALIGALGAEGNAPTLLTPGRSRFVVDYVKAWR